MIHCKITMSQERLSRLVILSIKKEMLEDLEYKKLISQFASQKVRKIDFKWDILYYVRNTGRLYCISWMKEYTSVPYIGGISVRYK